MIPERPAATHVEDGGAALSPRGGGAGPGAQGPQLAGPRRPPCRWTRGGPSPGRPPPCTPRRPCSEDGGGGKGGNGKTAQPGRPALAFTGHPRPARAGVPPRRSSQEASPCWRTGLSMTAPSCRSRAAAAGPRSAGSSRSWTRWSSATSPLHRAGRRLAGRGGGRARPLPRLQRRRGHALARRRAGGRPGARGRAVFRAGALRGGALGPPGARRERCGGSGRRVGQAVARGEGG